MTLNMLLDSISEDIKAFDFRKHREFILSKRYLSTELLLNKNFDGYLVRIDSIKVDLDAFSIFSNEYFLMYSTFIFALERSSFTISALIDESSFEISFIFIFIKSEKITDIDKSEYIKRKIYFFLII